MTAARNPIGQYTSDNRGYVPYFEDLTRAVSLPHLRELENEGYVPDTELKKMVYMPKSGRTTEIT